MLSIPNRVEVGHFVFTNTLLPAIRTAGPGARIVVVTSWGHNIIKKPINYKRLSSLEGEQELKNSFGRYGAQKLVGLQFSMALQRRLANDGIYVNTCHPGSAKTEWVRDMRSQYGVIGRYILSLISGLFSQTVQIGALTQLYLATSPEVVSKGIKGQYYWPVVKAVTDEASELARDEKDQERYWNWAEGEVDAALKRVDFE